MSVFDQGLHQLVRVLPGTHVVRVPNLKSGTLYAVLARGHFGARATNVIAGVSAGSGAGLVSDLNTTATALQAAIASEYSVTAPNSYFVAGADANLQRLVPQISMDSDATTSTQVRLRVAVPDFNTPLDRNLAGIRCRISRDNGVSYGEVLEINTPFADGANFATFNLTVPYDTDAYVIFQGKFKDGTYGKQTRPWQIHGCKRPETLPLAAPTIESVTGKYVSDAGKVLLSVAVSAVADPEATDLLVQLLDSTGAVRASAATPATLGAPVTVNLENVPTTVATYTVNAYSVQYGSRGAAATTTWETSTAAICKPDPFNTDKIFLSEVIERHDGLLQSKIRVVFLSALSPTQPKGNVYIRRKDGKDVSTLTKSDFLAAEPSTGDYLSSAITDAGAGVVYQVVVLAVGPVGTEADFTTAQVKEVNVFQYANYMPPQQTVPTITVLSDNSVRIDGYYIRVADSPEPVEIRLYKSETSTSAADLVASAPYVSLGNSTYSYSVTVPDFTVYAIGSGYNDITLRTYLENGGLTSSLAKTTVRVYSMLPSPPQLSSASVYVKTLRATASGITTTRTVTVQTNYTPSSGNGTTISITPPTDKLKIEISDAGAIAGRNAEVLTPSIEIIDSTAYVVASPSVNTGTRNVRVKWVTVYGDSAWSNSIAVTFPDAPVVDTTCDISTTAPRFSCNADGTISIGWSSGSFGNSRLGSYIVRRSKTNTVSSSAVVGIVTKGDVLSWTDNLSLDQQEATYYYWLEATNAQGYYSAAPVAVKLQSAATWAEETGVAAVSHRTTAPSSPTNLVAKGAQGGFSLTWSAVPERVKDYVLEWSALGTFNDTITYYVAGTSFFQTDGAAVSKPAADVYRWRVKARDYAGNLSSASSVSIPDNTAFGSVQDSAPAPASAFTLNANSDGSILLNLVASSAPYFHVRRLSNSTTWTPATSGSGDNSKAEAEFIIDGSSTKFTDTGLSSKKFYTYQVYTRSKLGTDAATYPAPPTPVQPTFLLAGVLRPNLITNGHFGTASGGFGTSHVGWSLGSNVSRNGTGAYTYNTTSFGTPKFIHAGATAAVVLSQTFQVVPGKRYTVMGVVNYSPTTQDGNGYIRVASAGTLLSASGGAASAPAPYEAATMETSGTDQTTARGSYRFISYSFMAPNGVSSMELQVGFEGRSAADAVSIYPGFIQVYLDE